MTNKTPKGDTTPNNEATETKFTEKPILGFKTSFSSTALSKKEVFLPKGDSVFSFFQLNLPH
jgi:hypothetical protein